MNEAELIRELPTLLETHWQLAAASVEPLGGGINSATALITVGKRRWVAKWVRSSGRAGFAFGLRTATRLESRGLRSGSPLPTVEGAAMILLDDGSLALLDFLAGRALTGDVTDQRGMGRALGRAHTMLATTMRHDDFLPELGDDQRLGGVADWILPAILSVKAEYRGLPPQTWGVVHGDPDPGAFREDDLTGEVGIIDWAAASEGPLLYDVASALMYLGGRAKAATFLQAYSANAPLPPTELDRSLRTMRRLRAIVQADYFGHRILSGDLTGITRRQENDQGLANAWKMLRSLEAG